MYPFGEVRRAAPSAIRLFHPRRVRALALPASVCRRGRNGGWGATPPRAPPTGTQV